MIQEHSSHSERGVVLVLVATGLALLFVFLVFAADIARAFCERRMIQIAADVTSLSAVNALGEGVNYDLVLERVVGVAAVNGVSVEEVIAEAPRCGSWTGGTFTAGLRRGCTSGENAVEVTVRRSMPLYFPNWFSQDAMVLEARAIAHRPPAPKNCIRPFGIEESALTAANIPVGGTFTIQGTQGAGNWGKIDLDGNSSSGTVYSGLMLGNQCDDAFAPGNWVSAGTGNAQIAQVFQTMLSDATPPLAWQNVVFAVTSDFPQGNGVVQIRRFMRVDLLGQRGNGQGWSATLRLLELDAQPDSATTRRRHLVE